MSEISIALVVGMWALVGIATAAARAFEVGNQDAGAIAAGVLWPIYLPYRLALIMWSGKP